MAHESTSGRSMSVAGVDGATALAGYVSKQEDEAQGTYKRFSFLSED
jgi:hypothetical protein